MRDQGRTRGFAIVVWTATAVILAAAVVVGNAALSGASEKSLSVLLSFAGGAVLASLADTLMPAATGRVASQLPSTAAGFFVSFGISEL
jgi:ZIP family zinc transporter